MIRSNLHLLTAFGRALQQLRSWVLAGLTRLFLRLSLEGDPNIDVCIVEETKTELCLSARPSPATSARSRGA